MKKISVYLLILLLTGPFALNTVIAGEQATPQEVYEMVIKAAKVVESLGKDAFPEFNNPKGEFVWKDSYVYVTECAKPTCSAHPFAPNLIGMDVSTLMDTRGNPFVMDLCRAIENPNGVWTEYWWAKPGLPKEQGFRKISFSIQVPNTPYQVAAGIYNDSMTVEELNKTLR